jgi:hypothetical protein
MPNKYIYVTQTGEKDYSRWLNVGVKPNGEATIYLSDLCHPGRLSALKSVACELSLLRDGLRTGAVQVVVEGGYFLARREGQSIQIEFRSLEDTGPTKVELIAEELMARLDDLEAGLLAPSGSA